MHCCFQLKSKKLKNKSTQMNQICLVGLVVLGINFSTLWASEDDFTDLKEGTRYGTKTETSGNLKITLYTNDYFTQPHEKKERKKASDLQETHMKIRSKFIDETPHFLKEKNVNAETSLLESNPSFSLKRTEIDEASSSASSCSMAVTEELNDEGVIQATPSMTDEMRQSILDRMAFSYVMNKEE